MQDAADGLTTEEDGGEASCEEGDQPPHRGAEDSDEKENGRRLMQIYAGWGVSDCGTGHGA